MKKNTITIIIIGFLVFLFSGCISSTQLITAQYVNKPVIVGPYWKVGGKLENYEELKKNKELRKFESEVLRVIKIDITTPPYWDPSNIIIEGDLARIPAYQDSIHADRISKDILMQNPSDNELILIKECFLASYLIISYTGSGGQSSGGVEGVIAPKP
ncbi:MAG TPA: hypothetical protein PKX79_08030 [Spirochaetota bacterium]|nr:hypothetical protein [Spirochaetota bacterium]HOK92304.1 hypothetical protein [Spirochaetota bacterium]HON15193.1 hypothetical protein [Spirochaetota bacterium]HPP95314.1 hypothetical protein [Spirochaetota bacterium]